MSKNEENSLHFFSLQTCVAMPDEGEDEGDEITRILSACLL